MGYVSTRGMSLGEAKSGVRFDAARALPVPPAPHLTLICSTVSHSQLNLYGLSSPFMHRTLLLEKMGSHKAYRSSCKGLPDKSGNEIDVDQAWKVKLPKSARALYKVAENVVYLKEYDHVLKNGMKNRKIAEEVCEYKEIKEELDEVLECLAEEVEEKAAAKKKKAEEHEQSSSTAMAIGVEPEGTAASSSQQLAPVPTVDDPLGQFRRLAHDTTRSHITLISEPKSPAKVAEAIKSSAAYAVACNDSPGYVCIVFDTKVSGESRWQPNVRVASLRTEYWEKLASGTLQALWTGDETTTPKICGQQLWMLFDGWKHGLENDLMRPFKDSKNHKLDAVDRRVYMHYDPVTLRDRRQQDWTSMMKQLVEYVFFLSAKEVDVPERTLANFPGLTNKMDMIGPLVMDRVASDEVWKLTIADKKKCTEQPGWQLARLLAQKKTMARRQTRGPTTNGNLLAG